jgi:hypothetical protein
VAGGIEAADERMTRELQNLGREFGCPPGMRITAWLRDRLKQLANAEDACRRYVDGSEYVSLYVFENE